MATYTYSGSPVWIAEHLVNLCLFNSDVRPVILKEGQVPDERTIVEVVVVLKSNNKQYYYNKKLFHETKWYLNAKRYVCSYCECFRFIC